MTTITEKERLSWRMRMAMHYSDPCSEVSESRDFMLRLLDAMDQKAFELKLCEEFIKGIESAAEEILPGITKTQEDDMEMRGRNIIAAIAKHAAQEAGEEVG